MGRTDMLHDALDDARSAEAKATKYKAQLDRLRTSLVEIEQISRETKPQIDPLARIGRIASNALAGASL